MTDSPPGERWTLQPLRIDALPATIDLVDGGLTIGRDPRNEVVVPQSSFPGVSSHHARLTLVDGRPRLEDLGSKNKTLVHGRPVSSQALKHGDVFQLGPGGPRFAVLSSLGGGEETMEIPAGALGDRAGGRSIGAETMMIVREKLGIPEGANVEQMVRKKSRGALVLVVLSSILLVAGGWAAVRWLSDRGDRAVLDLEQKTAELDRKIAEQLALARAQIEEQREAWTTQQRQIDEARGAWETHRTSLEAERSRLEESLRKLEENEQSAAGEIAALRSALDENRSALELYDPVRLEEERLDRVRRVEQAVVLIEASVTFRHQSTGRILHVAQTEQGLQPNFDGRGQPVRNEGTGSGFCLGGGWILTNAHVVFKKGTELDPIEVGPRELALPTLELRAVFTGTPTRRPARLVRWAASGTDDLALVRIEPFEGMPVLESLDLDVGDPLPGSDVYLIGFPLGKEAMQAGDTMIASTFRGIVSRKVEHFLQVDAAVHPGQSGGPAIDAEGRVIGLVTAMQAVDAVAGSSAIGFITPIAQVRKIWPPPQ